METSTTNTTISPPRLFATLMQGLNIIAANIKLIILPLLLDLLIWLGPHLSIKGLVESGINNLFNLSNATATSVSSSITAFKTLWGNIQDLNLFSALRSVPVGLPSLMSLNISAKSPLGTSSLYVISNSQTAVLLGFALFLLGIVFGSIYFNSIAQSTSADKRKTTVQLVFWQAMQCLMLFVAMLVVLMIVFIPIWIFSQFITLISPGFVNVALIVIGIFIIWLMLPLVFSAHGIFVEHRSFFQSILISIRMVRYYLPGTGLFILIAILINYGLNLLWSSPPADSWFLLIGIIGHAFIASAVLAATFIYYQGGLRWMREVMRRVPAGKKAA
jgi:hypothetical protein